jgi:hypothetical protein
MDSQIRRWPCKAAAGGSKCDALQGGGAKSCCVNKWNDVERMSAQQSISEYSKCLSALKSSNADASIISTLFTLNGLNPTVSDLNSSRIHVYLAQNVAKRSGIIGDLARQLIAKWKRLLPSASSQSPPRPASSLSDANGTSPPRDNQSTHAEECTDYQQLLTLLKGGESKSDQTGVYLSLFTLNGLNPTVSDLNSSRIHVYLAQNVAIRSGVTGDLARQLVAKWKRLLPSASSQSPPPSHSKMPRSPPPSSACSTQHQSVSSKQVARHEPHSAACAESSSKKAKLSEGSPPPDTASSQAQSRKAFRDRMQALLEKVTTLCSLPSPQPHFPPPPPPPPPTSKRISRKSQVKPHVANCEGLQSTSALVHRIDDCMCAACLPLRVPVSQLTAGWHTLEALILRTSSTCCACIQA